MKKFQLPYGVQDYLPEECYNKNILEQKLSKIYYSNGFERIETSSLEYYDLFDGIFESSAINKMFKMTDNDGSLLVLRPDITVQICRMASVQSDNSKASKLFYIANSFEYLPDSSTARSREFAQSGVEILGKSGVYGDIELVILAIKTLLSVGVKDFLIDIGHVDYFNGLLSESGLNDVDAKILSGYINNKDMLGVERFLQSKEVCAEFKNKFMILPSLFGNESILSKAENLCDNDISKKAIENLKEIFAALKAVNLDKYASIDLGMLKNSYYSGIVIKGITGDLGVSLLDGGRYDKLGDKFNSKLEAVGFAIGTKRLLKVLDNQGMLSKLLPCDIAYINLNGFDAEEFAWAEKIRDSGKRAVKLFCDKNELLVHCKNNNINKAVVFDKNGMDDIDI